MVRDQIARVRLVLALHFMVLAFLTALLVATGTNRILLPLLVLFIGTASFLFVDWLQWWSLHHSVAYFLMIGGTIAALFDYYMGTQSSDSTSRQLYSIASLLVYPELVLMMQRKSMRLFEQMAIFLLLEIIVAALVNDNVLFGILLAPIVVLWVSSLLLLTRYTALIRLEPLLDRPTPRFVELLVEYWKKMKGNTAASQRPLSSVTPDANQFVRPIGWAILLGQAAPIGLASLIFAALYFYLLPRTKNENVTPLSAASIRTGFTDELALGVQGRVQNDKTTIMRVAFVDGDTGRPYELVEPPYIRGAVVTQYVPTQQGGNFHPSPIQRLRSPARLQEASGRESVLGGRDNVRVQFDVEPLHRGILPTIAPTFGNDESRDFISIIPFDWTLINNRAEGQSKQHRLVYEVTTSAFQGGIDPGILPDSQTLYGHPDRPSAIMGLHSMSNISPLRLAETTEAWVTELMQRAALSTQFRQRSPVAFARELADYFALSGEFAYTLQLDMMPEPGLDPIADFVTNHKRGHCQYFAAALVFALRQNKIPARIVIGFHPLEYNSLGRFFNVRNSDAHAWVEAHFTKKELADAGINALNCENGAWVRLDPTPAGEGSNAGTEMREQESQAAAYMQRLWNDYFLDSQQLAERNTLYKPIQESTRETYQQLMATVTETIKRMRDQQLAGGAIKSENWFSWQTAALIILGGGAVVMCWRIVRWLPKMAPHLAKRLGLLNPIDDVRAPFFRNCLILLRKAGFRRESHQTASEHTAAAANALTVDRQWSSATEHLGVLTDAYYAQRFGGVKQFSDSEHAAIQSAIQQLEYRLK